MDELGFSVRESVTSIIAEDVLVSIASDDAQDMELRRKAIYLLADLWEHRTIRSVRDFFPLLYSVWDAKARVPISYGTLAGTSELLPLRLEDCYPAVIDYFSDGDDEILVIQPEPTSVENAFSFLRAAFYRRMRR